MPNYHARNHIKPKHVVHRMVNKTTFIDGGCWLWNGSQDGRGYGHICFKPGAKPEKVHRISAHYFLGYDFDLTGPLIVLHKRECPNRHCWNPEHLYIGTYSENMWDAMALGHTYRPSIKEKKSR